MFIHLFTVLIWLVRLWISNSIWIWHWNWNVIV